MNDDVTETSQSVEGTPLPSADDYPQGMVANPVRTRI